MKIEDGSHPDIVADFTNLYTKEIESFSDSIINDTPVLVPLSDGVQVQEIVEAAYYAAEKEKVVNIDKFFGRA